MERAAVGHGHVAQTAARRFKSLGSSAARQQCLESPRRCLWRVPAASDWPAHLISRARHSHSAKSHAARDQR